VDHALTTLRSEQKVWVYRVRLALGIILILTALATLFTGGRIGFANVGSAAILLIITVLFFLQLALKSRRVARLLNPEAEPTGLASSLTEARTNALPVHNAPVSIAERTTLKLNTEDSQKSNHV